MLICPKCGKTGKEKKFMEAFCVDCYPYNLKTPEKIVEIEVCKRCRKMRFMGEWIEYSRKKIEEYIAGKCRGDFSSVEYDLNSQIAIFTIRKDDSEAQVERKIPFKEAITICPDCSKIAGGYYEAIIQLRGNEGKIKKYAKLLTKMLSRSTFISKVDEKKEGTDLYVGKTRAVLDTLAELRVKRKITRKLAGTKHGKKFYRTTFLLRFE